MIKTQPNELKISWSRLQLLMVELREFSKISDPIAQFNWKTIGLKWVHKPIQGSFWHFEIIDKQKLTWFFVKHGIHIENGK